MIVKAKNTTTNKVVCVIYPNTETTGTALTSMAISDTNKRIKVLKWSNSEGSALTHSLSMSLTTDNETYGFEPLHLGVFYEVTRLSE
jgi:hypothetical protein